MVYDKDYLRQIDELPETSKDSTLSRARFVGRGFSLSLRLPLALQEIYPSIEDELAKVLNSQMEELSSTAIRNLEQRMPHLISFMESTIDNEPWERLSGTILLEDGETVETGLVLVLG